MKHDLRITALLVSFYLIAQIVGLGIVYNDIKVEQHVTETGQTVTIVSHPDTALGARPEVQDFDAIAMVLVSILVGTGFVLLIVRFNKINVWKIFFFSAVFSSITIAVGVFVSWYIAAMVGIVLSAVKLLKRNLIIHNVTEVLIYAGIAVLFAPLFQPLWVIILLLFISAYDMFAVWKSRHMVKMAEFQIKSEVFAGLSIPYKPKIRNSGPKTQGRRQKTKINTAILGGGDVAFPLIFASVVMESLIKGGLLGPIVLFKALVISVMTAITLLLLLVFGKRGHYYPAMPFLTAGCLAGYGILLLI